MDLADQAVGAARGAGLSPEHVLAIIAAWRPIADRFDLPAAVLYLRLKRAKPGDDPATGWPPASMAVAASAARESAARREAAIVARMEARRREREAF